MRVTCPLRDCLHCARTLLVCCFRSSDFTFFFTLRRVSLLFHSECNTLRDVAEYQEPETRSMAHSHAPPRPSLHLHVITRSGFALISPDLALCSDPDALFQDTSFSRL